MDTDNEVHLNADGWQHVMSGVDVKLGKENLKRFQSRFPDREYELRSYLASRIDYKAATFHKEPGYSIWVKGA